MRRLVTLCSTVVLLSACNGTGAPTTPNGTPIPTGTPNGVPSPGASAAPSGMVAEAATLTIDGVAKTLPTTFEKNPGSRGTTFTVGNLKSSSVLNVHTLVFGVVPAGTSAGMQNLHWYAQQGNAQVQQTYQWDDAPEVETWTQAGGKGTYTFKGKMKRIMAGNVGPATIVVEGSVSGIPL